MRTLLDTEPFQGGTGFKVGHWPAHWVGQPGFQGPEVVAFRLRFRLDQATSLRLHVSADERYELYIDGVREGQGPERGEPDHWYFESYDLTLAAGEHVIVARTWHLGDLSPGAQMSFRHGFVLAAEGVSDDLLNTGIASWECKRVDGYEFIGRTNIRGWYFGGTRFKIDGRRYPWGIELGAGDGWSACEKLLEAASGALNPLWVQNWRLQRAVLPSMLDEPRQVARAVHVESEEHEDTTQIAIKRAHHLADEVAGWEKLMQANVPLTIAANTWRRIIVDLGDYYCGYNELRVSGGAAASVRMRWTEGLFESPTSWVKGSRDELEGKYLSGCGDTFIADGGANRSFKPLWWQCGRYLEVVVKTAEEALTIEILRFCESRYPHAFVATFEADDERLAAIAPLAMRTLETCSHETYMDCPHYEQFQYVGDTRVQVLTTYATSADDRLPRKALTMFDRSRMPNGFTQSRYPNRIRHVIPTFSLLWISMVHDFALWRDDRDFVRSFLPGVRAVIDGISATLTLEHLLKAPLGWNFHDWVDRWGGDGVPPHDVSGVCASSTLQFAMTLRQAAELEELVGIAECAQRFRRKAAAITKASIDTLWDEQRGLFAETAARDCFDEHAQCYALLGGQLPDALRQRIAVGLAKDAGLDRATVYFMHYLFEAYRLIDRNDLTLQRLTWWSDLRSNGLKTVIECPEPTRSDCHAWGAHPVYHYFASILGIRPAGFGFKEVNIEPKLGGLAWAEGSMPHPCGTIRARIESEGGTMRASVTLPQNLYGSLVWGKARHALRPGLQIIEIDSAARSAKAR